VTWHEFELSLASAAANETQEACPRSRDMRDVRVTEKCESSPILAGESSREGSLAPHEEIPFLRGERDDDPFDLDLDA